MFGKISINVLGSQSRIATLEKEVQTLRNEIRVSKAQNVGLQKMISKQEKTIAKQEKTLVKQAKEISGLQVVCSQLLEETSKQGRLLRAISLGNMLSEFVKSTSLLEDARQALGENFAEGNFPLTH